MALSLTRQSNIQKYTPKKATVSDVYKSVSKLPKMSGSVKASAIKALKSAGYADSKISKLLNRNEQLPIAKLKQVAKDLKTGKVYGFATKDPNIAVKQYLNHERLKGQSLARIRKEHMLEERAEDAKNSLPASKRSDSSINNRVNLPF